MSFITLKNGVVKLSNNISIKADAVFLKFNFDRILKT